MYPQGAKGSLPEACRLGDVARVNKALGKKAGSAAAVNIETEAGVTPLAIAADGGHLEVIATLLKAGANVNQTMKVRSGRGRAECQPTRQLWGGQFGPIKRLQRLLKCGG
jgi:hypothetical protein